MHLACVGHEEADGEYVRGVKLGLVDLEVRVGKGGVGAAVAKGPLHIDARVVVIRALHAAHLLAGLIVVGHERIDLARIGEGEFAREVEVAGHETGQRIAAEVAREHDVDDPLGERFDVGNDARTAFVEHEYDGLAGGGEGLDYVALKG